MKKEKDTMRISDGLSKAASTLIKGSAIITLGGAAADLASKEGTLVRKASGKVMKLGAATAALALLTQIRATDLAFKDVKEHIRDSMKSFEK